MNEHIKNETFDVSRRSFVKNASGLTFSFALSGTLLGRASEAFAADSALIQATPSAPSESDAARALVDRLRDGVVPATALSRVATVSVGGETATPRTSSMSPRVTGWRYAMMASVSSTARE